ncbi:thiotemplate mechanism natural product synthetase [Grosmannia clavigera kw1407]|uniref:Thiotemplate mechanism natural product synthetase n=1 Tax=Grosmannia clavigera (strain kw1407 / UAMH 11150) TaxID=655863 RepID=F0XSF2_GROCL|nr:thiotemplate mechanism natural product synthetase [Grosmannia clavigera kw1407]EFW99106.1 thiotemplate mechanism natural product synthetase [Grosmannia clavigera kw1407]
MGFGSRPPAMANCVGQFASALPVKIPLWQVAHDGDGTFRSLVSAVGKNISDVKKNELFPAVEIAEAIRETGSDYTPPRVAVTYSPKLADAGCRLFPVNGVWDLFFCFLESEEDVKVGIIYDPTIFSALDVRDMKTLWVRLAAISKSSNAMVRDMLEWLPEHTSLPIVPLKSQRNPLRHIHHWFDAHAQTNPDAEALSSGEQDISITYGGLYASTELKAKFLLYNGISAGDRVLVKLERGFQTLEWMLGILKSGAAFIYVDVDSPKNQEDFILENAGPSLVINKALVEEYSERVMGEPFDCDLATPKYGTSDDDLAYIIYTSGSTGKPKGVMVEHGNIACFVKASTSAYRCGFGTRVLQLASFTFDGSILEWTTALCTGGWSDMQITPSALGTLPVSRSLSCLRLISVGGEAGSRGIFERWHSRVDIVNAYGPTEAAIAVSFNRINRSDLLPDIISVGRANKGSELYICAENFRPVLGQDSVGEICISGSQVARGYCQLPIQTAKSFSVHEDGNRMYRTGDHGKILSDGSLVVLGRVDREFKVRGYRIRPEEIEGAILSAKVGVSEASVLISEEGTEMIAAVTPDSVSQSRLFASLRSKLVNYKVPSRIVKLGRMPKNASGKLDHPAIRQEIRAALARDSHIDGTSNTEVLSDEDDIETRERNREQDVGKIWTRLLHRNSSPASNVNFFDIGGHSLLVPQLHDALKQAFPGKAVRLVDLFHQSTIAQQAVLLGDDPKIGATKPTYTKRNKKHTHVCRERKDSSDSSSSACRSCFETKIPKLATNSDKEVSEHVAIVGLAGRFPGAMCPDEFYDNLVKGYSGIRSSASSIAHETLDGNVWVPQAGVLDNIEDFDHQFWNLTREEATEMDPQQRLFLEMADEALRDAGIDFKVANPDFGSRVGIFVGSANNSYHVYTESVSSDSFLKENRGLVAPSISARTAYQLNFSGPNVTVQTNCASSTVALSLACDALRLGRCEIAVVGGISVQLFEGGYVTQEGQIFSPQGVCRPFDAKADGTVPADAVAAVVLKRYSAAVQDSSSVYARILGTGIGSDGAREKAGYQVPSPRGQAEVIKSAWRTAGISPNRLCYVELHGSGTPVGDALEVEGLTLAMRELTVYASGLDFPDTRTG